MTNDLLIRKAKDFLTQHIPGSISDGCDKNIVANLPVDFINTLYNNQPIAPQNLEVNPFDIDDIFPPENIKDRLISTEEEYLISEANLEEISISGLIENFGKDAFGMYLPFHFYDRCWGIYLFKEIIESRILTLYSLFSQKISLQELKQLYYYAIYRHELFHYQVERFATKIELITKKQVYRPSRTLFNQVRNSEDWLEEALAENAVTKSTLVSKRTNVKATLLKEIYERDLQDMPPGYKHYKCKKFGGPEEAHRLFASQLIDLNINPSIKIADLFSIKNEFIAVDKKVPTYMVTGFKNVTRISL